MMVMALCVYCMEERAPARGQACRRWAPRPKGSPGSRVVLKTNICVSLTHPRPGFGIARIAHTAAGSEAFREHGRTVVIVNAYYVPPPLGSRGSAAVRGSDAYVIPPPPSFGLARIAHTATGTGLGVYHVCACRPTPVCAGAITGGCPLLHAPLAPRCPGDPPGAPTP